MVGKKLVDLSTGYRVLSYDWRLVKRLRCQMPDAQSNNKLSFENFCFNVENSHCMWNTSAKVSKSMTFSSSKSLRSIMKNIKKIKVSTLPQT